MEYLKGPIRYSFLLRWHHAASADTHYRPISLSHGVFIQDTASLQTIQTTRVHVQVSPPSQASCQITAVCVAWDCSMCQPRLRCCMSNF